MTYSLGDKVLCPPSGSVAGPRKGVVIRIDSKNGQQFLPILVKYIDPPEDHDAWVHPIKKITK